MGIDCYRGAISDLVRRGWMEHHAESFMCLQEASSALGRALREHDPCYAATTYAISDALFVHRHLRYTLVPPPMYIHHTGRYSLVHDDPGWNEIEEKQMYTSKVLVQCSC